jgi:hypothetical protein
MIAKTQTFEDAKISLDGGSFYGCTFRRCTLVYSGLLPVVLEGGSFDGCKWEFSGPALNGVQFMSAIYKAGGGDLMERTFEAIRGGQPAPGNPTTRN